MCDRVKELRRIQSLTDEEINEKKKNKLATEIVDLFEELLDRKVFFPYYRRTVGVGFASWAA